MKRYFAENVYHCKVTELPAPVVLGAAGVGGLMYWGIIFPVDVVKSAMQTDSIVKAERTYPTMLQAVQVVAPVCIKCTTLYLSSLLCPPRLCTSMVF